MSKENERTMPWLACEFAKVNGYPVVYTPGDSGDIVVRMPGGWSATLAQLARTGYAVQQPTELRDFSGRGRRRP